jgi:ABC-2 type transport system permease protein
MNKILLIIQREYLSRVKKKEFLLVTFLVPIFLIAMMVFIIYISLNQGDTKKIEVLDETGWFAGKLKNTNSLQFSTVTGTAEELKKGLKKSDYDYFLHIPQGLNGVKLYSEKKPSTLTTANIETAVNNVAQARRLAEAHIDSAVLAAAKKNVTVEAKQLTSGGEQDAHSMVAFGIGYFSAFLIYMSLLLFGVQVMRGVIEEKVSRIIEVIISSVKPFELMLGKIIGVGLVGLTQFLLWIVLSVGLVTVGTSFFKDTINAKKEVVAQALADDPTPGVHNVPAGGKAAQMLESFSGIPFGYDIACFLFYFLFGYFLYSALFAAVGSAVDSETETQQFVMPITMPLVFTFIVSQSAIIQNPDSALSVWLSMIPFTSPIAMMIRIPYGVPAWQLATSMALLVVGFVVCVWAAGRIYRVGILMYGKKPSYKEIAKWFMYKD